VFSCPHLHFWAAGLLTSSFDIPFPLAVLLSVCYFLRLLHPARLPSARFSSWPFLTGARPWTPNWQSATDYQIRTRRWLLLRRKINRQESFPIPQCRLASFHLSRRFPDLLFFYFLYFGFLVCTHVFLLRFAFFASFRLLQVSSGNGTSMQEPAPALQEPVAGLAVVVDVDSASSSSAQVRLASSSCFLSFPVDESTLPHSCPPESAYCGADVMFFFCFGFRLGAIPADASPPKTRRKSSNIAGPTAPRRQQQQQQI